MNEDAEKEMVSEGSLRPIEESCMHKLFVTDALDFDLLMNLYIGEDEEDFLRKKTGSHRTLKRRWRRKTNGRR